MPRYHYRRRMDDNINSIDDCIEGIEEPLYGFRTNITLLRDSPCILGYTCDNPSTSGTENIIILQVFISNSHQIFFFIIFLWIIEFECEMISFQTDTFMESNTHTTLIYWLLNLIFSTKQYYWLVLNFVSYKSCELRGIFFVQDSKHLFLLLNILSNIQQKWKPLMMKF